ncbi:MAG: hypothetical protein KDD47_05490 [Acidobacteria bacterium]|nr:hypothetical protein [Acidobacteriota bacterium]
MRKSMASFLNVVFAVLVLAGVAGAQTIPADPEPDWPDVSPFDWVWPENTNITLTLSANLLSDTGGQQSWSAMAIDTTTGNRVVTMRGTVTYGRSVTTYKITAQRFTNRWGFPAFGPKVFSQDFVTEYDADGNIATATVGTFTWFSAYVGSNPLTNPITGLLFPVPRKPMLDGRTLAEPGDDLPQEPGEWTSNGCSGPCSNHWKPCCDVHDECYCKGGDATDRKNCDENFKACLQGMGMSNWKAGLYHKGVRVFGASHFNCTDPMGC